MPAGGGRARGSARPPTGRATTPAFLWGVVTTWDDVRRCSEMVRHYAEPVDVRPAAVGAHIGAPEAFVWRDRLYVVREVLGHWLERKAWWTSDAARAVHGDLPAEHAVPAPTAGALVTERRVWRVEASPGRAYDQGVYDLSQGAGPQDGEWHLLRVAD